ncbi:MAG: MarR family winged helix-turn-helix transcriptional regulator [Leucobacter sp.]
MHPAQKIDADPLAELADVILSIAHRIELRGTAARGVIPLTNAEITVMRELHRSPGATATRLATLTGLQRSNVSAMARQLEKAGLLQQVPPNEGNRGVGFAPTELAEATLATLRRHWADKLAEVSPDILAPVIAELASLEEILRALPVPASAHVVVDPVH